MRSQQGRDSRLHTKAHATNLVTTHGTGPLDPSRALSTITRTAARRVEKYRVDPTSPRNKRHQRAAQARCASRPSKSTADHILAMSSKAAAVAILDARRRCRDRQHDRRRRRRWRRRCCRLALECWSSLVDCSRRRRLFGATPLLPLPYTANGTRKQSGRLLSPTQ